MSRSVVAGRLLRALKNLLETYPAFIALVLALVVTGKTGGLGATGAWLWLVARVVYVVLYAAGIPVFRTLVWSASIIGLVLMLIRLMSLRRCGLSAGVVDFRMRQRLAEQCGIPSGGPLPIVGRSGKRAPCVSARRDLL